MRVSSDRKVDANEKQTKHVLKHNGFREIKIHSK